MKVDTKGMSTEGDVNVANTTNVKLDSGEEWIARVETVRRAMEILGQRLNVVDGKFKTLEDFNLEETRNIFKELERCQQAEFEMKEVITSLECRLMEVLSTILRP